MPGGFLYDDGVPACAVVDDLFKVREPQVNAAGVYFVTPTEDSVRRVIQVILNFVQRDGGPCVWPVQSSRHSRSTSLLLTLGQWWQATTNTAPSARF